MRRLAVIVKLGGKWRFAIALFALQALAGQRAIAQQDGGGALLSSAEERVATYAAQSDCAKYEWDDRGLAPVGYIKGMALTYAKSVCEMKRGVDSAARLFAQPNEEPSYDALAWYGENAASSMERLRTVYALAIGLGMRESSGNPTEGRDKTIAHPTPETAEAGLFQTSFDSFTKSGWFPSLFSAYKANPSTCRLAVFLEGVRPKHEDVLGTGAAADYQTTMKACPALAVEYAVIMLRINRAHFGPINRRKAELRRECRAMLQGIESLATCAP